MSDSNECVCFQASSSRDVKDVKPAADSAETSTRRRGVAQPVSSTSQANSAAKEERNDRPGRSDRADRVERAPLRRGAEERRTGSGTGSDNADAASADRPERTIRKRISPPPGAETKVCESLLKFETGGTYLANKPVKSIYRLEK